MGQIIENKIKDETQHENTVAEVKPCINEIKFAEPEHSERKANLWKFLTSDPKVESKTNLF